MNIDLNFLKERPLSYSSIKEFAKSPSHYIQYVLAKKEPSKEMNMGSMIHCLLLTPNEFSDQFAVSPNVDRRTKDGKAKWDEFCAEANGKAVITEDDLELATEIVNKFHRNESLSYLLNSCSEFESKWVSEVNSLPFTGYIDGESEGYLIEIKTTSDASPSSFIKDFYNRKYYLQAALYYMATSKTINYIVIETKPPYNMFHCPISKEYIDFGIRELNKLTNSFNECMAVSGWHLGYEFMEDGPIVINPPSWVK